MLYVGLMGLPIGLFLCREDLIFMNIAGLDMVEVGQRMEMYVQNHIKGFVLSVGVSMFQESYLFDFTEIKATIPPRYHYLFKDTDKFNGASGFIEHDSLEYTIMLLADESDAVAYLLTLLWTDANDKENTAIIGDFLCP